MKAVCRTMLYIGKVYFVMAGRDCAVVAHIVCTAMAGLVCTVMAGMVFIMIAVFVCTLMAGIVCTVVAGMKWTVVVGMVCTLMAGVVSIMMAGRINCKQDRIRYVIGIINGGWQGEGRIFKKFEDFLIFFMNIKCKGSGDIRKLFNKF